MATEETSYLKLPYNEANDAGFRALYGQSMDKVDAIFPNAESIKFSPSLFINDDGFFTPSKDFKRISGLTKYYRKGNLIFFEVALESNKAIEVGSNANIPNILMGTISRAFPRARGYFITAINGVAARYAYSGNTGVSVYVTAFGGKVANTTIPKGTYFGFSGRFMTTS